MKQKTNFNEKGITIIALIITIILLFNFSRCKHKSSY